MVPENKVGIERTRKGSRHPVSYESFDVGIRDMIDRVSTTEDAKEVVDKIDRGKKLLESLGIFEENATRFSMLEFEVYLKIASECLYDDLPVHKKAVAKWLSRLTDEEIDGLRREVKGGRRIGSIYGRERRNRSAAKRKSEIEAYAEFYIGQFDDNGQVEVPVGCERQEQEVYKMVKRHVCERGAIETTAGVFKRFADDNDVDQIMWAYSPSDSLRKESPYKYMAYRILHEVLYGNKRVKDRAERAVAAIYESGYLGYNAHRKHVAYIERHLAAIQDSSGKSLNYWSEYE